MRKAILVGCLVTVFALLAGLILTAAAAPDISSPRTITVTEISTQSHFVNVGPSRTSLGDSFYFSGILRHGGEPVGNDGARCTFVHVGPLRAECDATFKLPGGKVTAQALLHVTNGLQTFTFAVTGGTATFRNVRGQATIEQLTGRRSRITFELIP